MTEITKTLKVYTPSICTGRYLLLPSSVGQENILKDLTVNIFEGMVQDPCRVTFHPMGNFYRASQ